MAKAKSAVQESARQKKIASLQKKIRQNPKQANLRYELAMELAADNKFPESEQSIRAAKELAPKNADIVAFYSQLASRTGELDLATELAEQALALNSEHAVANFQKAQILYNQRQPAEAVNHIEQALAKEPNNVRYLVTYSNILNQMHRSDEAAEQLIKASKIDPKNYGTWNNLGVLKRDAGLLTEAIECYGKALELDPKAHRAHSNWITTMHYHPQWSKEKILELIHQWDGRFTQNLKGIRHQPADLTPTKKLRIGMFSDGFRMHPVGQMIIKCLEYLPEDFCEIIAYTSNNDVDHITSRIQSLVEQWVPMGQQSDQEFAETLRQDELDIVIDLSGHNAGNRMLSMAMEPAPIQVKWVGGLINTTGVGAMDYLISDPIETPESEGQHYVESLIRLPDDYICYEPPEYVPKVGDLPMSRRGYVTIGCFNNAAKINETVLEHWAQILKQVEGSQLFLKSQQYNAEPAKERVWKSLERLDIPRDRVRIEGPSNHQELLNCYNEVDVALDPWPYSGGLTTCEALLMGVPVVTLPGPTFAGRHSATHLVNAGLPELVTASWQEYKERVLELVADPQSLATIRNNLRDQLLTSPVCDGPRFASHFAMAMRAIWVRYTEGRDPAALGFTNDGKVQFEGDAQPMDIPVPKIRRRKVATANDNPEYNWKLEGQIVTLDNTGSLLSEGGFARLNETQAFAVVTFDYASRLNCPARWESDPNVQVFPHAQLGDGKEGTLYACLDARYTATIPPLDETRQRLVAPETRNGLQVLTRLPVNTVALDSIEGLDSLDWLILDEFCDATQILEHGKKALRDTLLIQVGIAFQLTHEKQPNLAEITHWASRNGFRFYRLNNAQNTSYFPEKGGWSQRQATGLNRADALFIPDYERLEQLTTQQRIRLSFLLHSVYNARDLAYSLLNGISEEEGDAYLESIASKQTKAPGVRKKQKEFKVPDAPFMSEAEKALFRKGLDKAKSYFEFGSGGSSIWAAEQDLVVHGVESDARWVESIRKRIGDKCDIQFVDIGPTKEWGYPESAQHQHLFKAYSEAIDNCGQSFDLILVDGRFRVACTVKAILHAMENGYQNKVRIFIHDFWNRQNQYEPVLEFLETVEQAESAGLFKIKMGLNPSRLYKVWEQYAEVPY